MISPDVRATLSPMSSRVRVAITVVLMAAALWAAPPADAAKASPWSLLPPAVAITLALVFRDVLVSLVLGTWLGTTMLADGHVGAGLLRVVDSNIRNALTSSDHVSIIVFSMLLGGMVGVMSRCGGTMGIVRVLEPLATTPRRAQVATWCMGVAVFFDDYSNTLIVGNSMRPVTDRHRVSREKLAFLVDSTAAPIACIALVSTWIGYQVSLLGDALRAAGADLNPFQVFLHSITYQFYPIFALLLTLTVALWGRDWGPMLAAERRAAAGELLSATAQPLADFESSGLAPDPETPARWFNAALPVLAVIVVTLLGLWSTGRSSLLAEGVAVAGLRDVIGAADAFTSLRWASFLGLLTAILLAVGQRLLDLRSALEAAIAGFRSMLMAAVVLTLAWALGQVCTDLDTAGFLVAAVGPRIDPALLPAAVFAVAAAVSFATGTSWGTMAILTPLAVPLVLHASGVDSGMVAATVSAILGGAVFGDHCSPISDTTIMSSMAASCDHVDHVRTQLPYALLAATVALVVGYLPTALLDSHQALSLVAGPLVILLWFRLVGRPARESAANSSPA